MDNRWSNSLCICRTAGAGAYRDRMTHAAAGRLVAGAHGLPALVRWPQVTPERASESETSDRC
jgi:hypothetical protein